MLEPAPESVSSYATPGQYVEMRIAGETGFFVLSSVPGASPWQLVMRAGGGASDVVLAIPEGSRLDLTSALGEGFPVAEARGGPLLLALAGTGIAAGPPIVRGRVAEGDASRTRVFVGVRDRADVALEPELRAWCAAGVEVYACLSQGPVDREARGLRFARGHVQDVVREEVAAGAASGGFVFAVGGAAMVDALRALAPVLGVEPSRVVTNY